MSPWPTELASLMPLSMLLRLLPARGAVAALLLPRVAALPLLAALFPRAAQMLFVARPLSTEFCGALECGKQRLSAVLVAAAGRCWKSFAVKSCGTCFCGRQSFDQHELVAA